MKRIVNIPDMLLLASMAVFFMHTCGLLATCVVFAFPVLLAVLYYLVVVMFAPIASKVPTVNSSWLSFDGFNACVFWKRRALETLWSYLCVLLVYLTQELVDVYFIPILGVLVFVTLCYYGYLCTKMRKK